MDVHVKAAITAGLRQRGIDVLTAQEDGTERWDDDRPLERATELRRVLFSQDDDLLTFARYKQSQGKIFSGLIYGHQLAATIGKYVIDLELVCKVLDADDMVVSSDRADKSNRAKSRLRYQNPVAIPSEISRTQASNLGCSLPDAIKAS